MVFHETFEIKDVLISDKNLGTDIMMYARGVVISIYLKNHYLNL